MENGFFASLRMTGFQIPLSFRGAAPRGIHYCVYAKRACRSTLFLGFTDKFFFALGTGDGDFSFPSGDTNGLPAMGAVKMPVLPIFYSVQHPQIPAIFLIPAILIPGKRPENCPNHQHIRNHRQGKLYNCKGKQHSQNAANNTCPQDCHIQFIAAVATLHKVPHPCGQLFTKTAEPATDSVHNITLQNRIYAYYIAKIQDFNLVSVLLTEYLIFIHSLLSAML